ncbi:radical SAM protein [Paenibacillus faecalis]|uniref:radical SAM protein n=1 Tax=Paenibacillus faecalis TaxID=2079532 RepID=UPI000D0E6CED|nr:radical SAM protein [Paenibacillus faecalis]
MYLKLIKENIEEISLNRDKPFYVYISLSNICNAKCVFCNVHDKPNKISQVDVPKLLGDLHSLGTRYVHFLGGGEPLVRKEIWDHFESITKMGMKFAITTNGFFLNEEKIIRLSKLNLNHILFSIDGHTSEIHDNIRQVPGLWKVTTRNIQLLKQYMPHVKVVINHVVNKLNIDHFSEMINLKKSIPYDFLNPILIKDCPELEMTEKQITNFNEQYEEYISLARELNVRFLYDNINFFSNFKENTPQKKKQWENNNFKCYYPQFASHVDCPTASVYPCDCTIHRDPKFFKVGSLSEKSFKEIWNDSPMANLRKSLENKYVFCKKNCDRANVLFNNEIEGVLTQ